MAYNWPYIDESLKAAVLAQLSESLSDKGSKGPIKAVEKAVAQYYGVPHCLFFSSATGAMHSLVFALGLRPGDEIIVPTYTFFATFSPFAFEGLKIVQSDCDAHGQISTEDVRRRMTARTRAVVCTHMWGIPSDLDALGKLCGEFDIPLIEDCSHAHFARFGERRVGVDSTAAVFSTNQKAITSGEGGFLLTGSRAIYERAVLFGHYNERSFSEISDSQLRPYALTGLGLKYRATTLSAAVLMDQMRKTADIESRRRANYERLFAAVRSSRVLENIVPPYRHQPGLYVFPLLAPDQSTRAAFLEFAEQHGCPYFDAPGSTRPLYDAPLFTDLGRSIGWGHSTDVTGNAPAASSFRNADSFFERIVKAPLWGYPGDEADIETRIQALARFQV